MVCERPASAGLGSSTTDVTFIPKFHTDTASFIQCFPTRPTPVSDRAACRQSRPPLAPVIFNFSICPGCNCALPSANSGRLSSEPARSRLHLRAGLDLLSFFRHASTTIKITDPSPLAPKETYPHRLLTGPSHVAEVNADLAQHPTPQINFLSGVSRLNHLTTPTIQHTHRQDV